MQKAIFLFAVWASSAGAQVTPPRPFTQNSSGLTQNNQSGLSQNLYGRTETVTVTEIQTTTGIRLPVEPTPFEISSRPVQPVTPAQIQAPAQAPTQAPAPAQMPAPAATSPQTPGLPSVAPAAPSLPPATPAP